MRLFVFKPSRMVDGKRVVSRTYAGRYTVEKGGRTFQVGLDTPYKAIAWNRLFDIALEKQKEREGLIAPRVLRDAAVTAWSGLLADYVADLRAQEQVAQHIKDTSRKIGRVFRETGWKTLSEIGRAHV